MHEDSRIEERRMLSLAIPLIHCASIMAAGSLEGGPSHQGLDRLVEKIISAESSGRSWLSGDHGRSRGLMQIQRANWQKYTTESWDRAFEPALNKMVGTSMVREIVKKYGTRANEALVVYTYNTGKFCTGDLPEWTKRHPNDIYRRIFNGR